MLAEYPNIRGAMVWLGKGALIGALVAGWGVYQRRQGFDAGADTALCAVAIFQDGNSAITRFDACKRIKNPHAYALDNGSDDRKHKEAGK